jgi:uncharacterized membrane protein (UPF0127 family)
MQVFYAEKLILDDCKLADTFWKRFKGLMLKKGLREKEGLLIEKCNSIHMFFMLFEIDAIFLDENDTIVKLVENLKPWKGLVLPVKNGGKVLEVKAGFIKQNSLKEGGKLIFKD